MNESSQATIVQKDKILLAAKALGAPVRLNMLAMMADSRNRGRSNRYGGGICVNEFARALGLLQSLVSYHVKVLKEAGLVNERREGRWVYYSLNPAGFHAFQEELVCRFRL